MTSKRASFAASVGRAGNRVSQSVGGTATRFGYNPAGQTTQVSREGRTTSYAYDGLGRRITATEETRYGTSTTRTSFDGLDPVQSTTAGAGTSTLIRDAVGALAEHVTASGEATWDLLDRLGSTVAGATGASITQLSSYDDWGAQQFETSGWSAPENFTGETTDPTQGLNHYYARTYDPSAATWTSQDPWRGLLARPQSLNRYAYVENNPTTESDALGYKVKQQRMPKLCVGWGCLLPPVTVGPGKPAPGKPPVAQTPTNPAPTQPSKPNPKAVGPNSQNDIQDRHTWEVVADILGIVGAVAGLAALIPSPAQPFLGALSAIASSASTVIACLLGGDQFTGCIIGIILAVVPIGGAITKVLVRDWVKDAVKGVVKALGGMGSALGLVMSGGDLHLKRGR